MPAFFLLHALHTRTRVKDGNKRQKTWRQNRGRIPGERGVSQKESNGGRTKNSQKSSRRLILQQSITPTKILLIENQKQGGDPQPGPERQNNMNFKIINLAAKLTKEVNDEVAKTKALIGDPATLGKDWRFHVCNDSMLDALDYTKDNAERELFYLNTWQNLDAEDWAADMKCDSAAMTERAENAKRHAQQLTKTVQATKDWLEATTKTYNFELLKDYCFEDWTRDTIISEADKAAKAARQVKKALKAAKNWQAENEDRQANLTTNIQIAEEDAKRALRFAEEAKNAEHLAAALNFTTEAAKAAEAARSRNLGLGSAVYLALYENEEAEAFTTAKKEER